MEEKAIYEVAKRQENNVINFEEYTMSTVGVLRQVAIIQEVMTAVMRKDEHFGTIPGTHKPSLYKPGAEKLSLVFRLRPEYEIRRSDLGNGHREYEVVCTLYHIPTGQSVGQGVGSAATMEGKYRYRGGEKEGTGQSIPKEYWNLKKEGKGKEAQALIGGVGFSAGKIDGNWEICSTGEKQEHDNPADYYNTILKMAKKRAHVDAILTATAASDIFTQDVEDMPEVIPGAKKAESKPPLKEPQTKTETQEPWKGKANDKITATLITKVIKKEDIDKDGKPYKRYTIIDSNGIKHKTFSDTFANIAIEARDFGLSVDIDSTPPENPAWAHDLVSIKLKTGSQPTLKDEFTPEKCHELVAVYKGMIENYGTQDELTEWERVNSVFIDEIKKTEPEAYVSLMTAFDRKFTELREG